MKEYTDKIVFLRNKLFNSNNKYDEDLSNYFVKENYLDYIANFNNLRFNQEKALDLLFSDNSEIIERCQKAIEINKTCFEAFYILFTLCDSLNFYYQSLDIQNTPIDDFNDYELNDVINIKMLIAHYYSDIYSFNQSLKFLDEIGNAIGVEKVLSKKVIAYNFLEDYKSIMNLYKNYEFEDPKDYIVFIVCLLKTGQHITADEIYDDMLDKFDYADYISKPQDLSTIDNHKAEEMMNAIESCFEIIESIPYFFSWAAEHVESRGMLN